MNVVVRMNVNRGARNGMKQRIMAKSLYVCRFRAHAQ